MVLLVRDVEVSLAVERHRCRPLDEGLDRWPTIATHSAFARPGHGRDGEPGQGLLAGGSSGVRKSEQKGGKEEPGRCVDHDI